MAETPNASCRTNSERWPRTGRQWEDTIPACLTY